ncbi:hypothetical protein WN944_022023 [Citrus x changshan-huyou]|uniref:Uncharacterized protein n=1 Tax=Citrus x changshan-huyou TaxID=2935761 RepID=A0AAP0R2Z8_9ROSI
MNTTSLLLTPPCRRSRCGLRLSDASHASPCLIICVLVLFGAVSLTFHYSHNLVCISPYDPLSRFGPRLYRPDALESDFGYLDVPWCRSKNGKRVEWTTKDLIEVLEEFVPIYETRPVKNNIYGMGFDQSFGPWFIARWLKLDLMIESGAFKDIQPGLKQALKVGFRHLVFEDNYDTGTGDHYSLRQLCDQSFIRAKALEEIHTGLQILLAASAASASQKQPEILLSCLVSISYFSLCTFLRVVICNAFVVENPIQFEFAMHLPTRLFLWDSLPRNAMGKVNKKELKKQLAAQQ